MSGITVASVAAAVGAAASVGSAAYGIASGGGKKSSAPTPAPTPVSDTGSTNTSKSVTDQSAAGPGRAANIAAGADQGSLNSDDQYSVKKKLLGD